MTIRMLWAVASVVLGLGGPSVLRADEPAGDSRVTVVHAGTLLADPRVAPLQHQSIVIADGVVREVRAGFVELPDARTIDLRDAWVLPGLIDLHVHLTTEPRPDGALDVVTASAAALAFRAAHNARLALAAGFTTVVDLGTGRRAHEEAVFALRNAIDSGLATGPRVLAVGSPLSIPGQSRAMRFRDEVDAVVGPQAVCSGADDCRRAVRDQVRRGADLISFYNTGSLLSVPSVARTFTPEEMTAIVEAAHALGRKVIADGGNTPDDDSGIRDALNAGADIIDTGTYLEAASRKLLRERKAFYVPHLYALQAAVGDSPESLESGTMGWLPRPILERLYALKQQTPAAVVAHREGVRMAFGSDPGVFPHGHNAREFPQYVAVVGMSPAEAIATATVNAAQALGRSQEIGRIAPGLAADLIATNASPLADVAELTRIRFVMRAGRVLP